MLTTERTAADESQVLTWLRSRTLSGKTAAGLYGSIVAQSRDPAFYASAGVPDTMEGRFGVIGLHLFLVLERIRSQGSAGDDLARALLETFMTDVDDNLREIGIADMGVPRRVKKAAAALHEHLDAYRAAMAASTDGPLRDALARYVFLDSGAGRPVALAAYVRQATTSLRQQPWAAIRAGTLSFPALIA
jgi:cytochrome b pre-mRNA-processing protein 3